MILKVSEPTDNKDRQLASKEISVETTAAHAGSPPVLRSWLPSAAGRERMIAERGGPLFHADWIDAVFLHFETDPNVLQPEVPWPLDLFEGRAFVSLVAFTMRGLRPRIGGRLAALPFKAIATHPFLNVRTYVKHQGDAGIYFLAEWLPNRLSEWLGPRVFGLPYRLGALDYDNRHEIQMLRGCVADATSGDWLCYRAGIEADAIHRPCQAGSVDEFVVERYTAFTSWQGLHRLFRIWHPPWPLLLLQASVDDHGLLALSGNWSREARLVAAHHSPGFPGVWMGRPHIVRRASGR